MYIYVIGCCNDQIPISTMARPTSLIGLLAVGWLLLQLCPPVEGSCGECRQSGYRSSHKACQDQISSSYRKCGGFWFWRRCKTKVRYSWGSKYCCSGYEFSRSSKDICLNKQDCKSTSCVYGTCSDRVNDYECTCGAGYTGKKCDININECRSSPCQNGGSCIDLVNSYQCVCPQGYSGLHCQIDVEVCPSAPCQNGGFCHENQENLGTYLCECLPGYTGVNCETDINECIGVTCENGASCDDLMNNYSCVCIPGYTGRHCESNIDECQAVFCLHGTCEDLIDDYQCLCQAGYTGDLCEIEVNECESSPCLNGGVCRDLVNSYECLCLRGYTGTHCETECGGCKSEAPFSEPACYTSADEMPVSIIGIIQEGLGFTSMTNDTIIYTKGSYYCCNNYDLSGQSPLSCDLQIQERCKRVRESQNAWTFDSFVAGQSTCRVDICFVLEMTPSIGEENWNTMKTFVSRLVERIPVSPVTNKVGLVTFDTYGLLDIPLDDNKNSFMQKLSEVEFYTFVGAETAEGIWSAREECFQEDAGDRPDFRNLAILITASEPTDAFYAISEANKTRATGALIMSIGVGSLVNSDTLLGISGGQEKVFLTNFDCLLQDLDVVISQTCSFTEVLGSCDTGMLTSWNSGQHPEMQGCPQLSPPVIEGDKFSLPCLISHSTTHQDARFLVTFLADEIPIFEETVTAAENTVNMDQYYLTQHTNQDIRCQVETFYVYQEKSPKVGSAPYWAGIAFNLDRIIIAQQNQTQESGTGTAVNLFPVTTLPVVCNGIVDPTNCVQEFSILTTGPIYANQADDDNRCTTSMNGSDWNMMIHMAYNLAKAVQVNPARSAIPIPKRFATISVQVKENLHTYNGTTYNLWEGLQLPTIPVEIQGGEIPHMCKFIGTSQITTFDGWQYTVSAADYYMMLNSREAKIKIQAQLCSCGTACSYICGIAVNEKKEKKEKQKKKAETRIMTVDEDNTVHLLGCEKPFSPITSNPAGTEYHVETVSGISITVEVHTIQVPSGEQKSIFNIFIVVPVQYSSGNQKLRGLCGNYDGDMTNEFHQDGNNMTEQEFEKKSSTPDGEIFNCDEDFEPETKPCKCGITMTSCELENPLVPLGMPAEPVKMLLPPPVQDSGARRRKRSTREKRATGEDDDDDIDYTYKWVDMNENNPVPSDDSPPPWGTYNNTEEEAIVLCNTALYESYLVSVCTDHMSTETVDGIISSCVEGIQRTGISALATVYEGEYKQVCIQNILNQADVSDPENPMSDPVFSQLFTSVLNALCPRNCSGHGVCQSALCVCDSGYIGIDCSIPEGTQPTVLGYAMPEACDIRRIPCRTVRVKVSDLIKSDQLTCRSSIGIIGEPTFIHERPGEYFSPDTVFCPLPDPEVTLQGSVGVYKYAVSLSNDGIGFSAPFDSIHIVSDSDKIWESCALNEIYSSKSTTCEIDGHCYQSDEEYDSCQICDPTVSTNSWTIKQECGENTTATPSLASAPDSTPGPPPITVPTADPTPGPPPITAPTTDPTPSPPPITASTTDPTSGPAPITASTTDPTSGPAPITPPTTDPTSGPAPGLTPGPSSGPSSGPVPGPATGPATSPAPTPASVPDHDSKFPLIVAIVVPLVVVILVIIIAVPIILKKKKLIKRGTPICETDNGEDNDQEKRKINHPKDRYTFGTPPVSTMYSGPASGELPTTVDHTDEVLDDSPSNRERPTTGRDVRLAWVNDKN